MESLLVETIHPRNGALPHETLGKSAFLKALTGIKDSLKEFESTFLYVLYEEASRKLAFFFTFSLSLRNRVTSSSSSDLLQSILLCGAKKS